jgi:hypothetical protein
MSFLRHGEIYPFDEGAITQDRALAHRKDEFPAGYSLAGCAPAEPASASPAGAHLARKRLRCTMQFQRTARSVLAVCLTPGDNLRMIRGGQVDFSPLFRLDWAGCAFQGAGEKSLLIERAPLALLLKSKLAGDLDRTRHIA